MLQAAAARAPHLSKLCTGLCRCNPATTTATAPATMSASSLANTSLTTEVKVSTSSAGLGRIILCRERQLNALGAAHVEVLRQQLLHWADPESVVSCVLLDSNNDRSFCSGGPGHQPVVDTLSAGTVCVPAGCSEPFREGGEAPTREGGDTK
jgi:hypothetical protein